MNSETKYSTRFILDTPQTISPEKVYDKSSPRFGQHFWNIRCLKNIIRVHEDVLVDKDFLKLVENGSILGKKYRFLCKVRANHLLRAELVKE